MRECVILKHEASLEEDSENSTGGRLKMNLIQVSVNIRDYFVVIRLSKW